MPKYLNASGKLTSAGQDLAAELYNPAVGTIIGWLAKGEAGTRVRYGYLPPWVLDRAQIDRDLREDIALETFCAALEPFLRMLDEGRYDAARGTTIVTYFLGACRNRLGDTINAHGPRLSKERSHDTSALLEQLRDDNRFHSNLDYDRLEDVDLAQRVLLKAPHDLRDALLLHIEDGITLKDAAIRVGSKPATIRSKLLRHRKKLARMHFAGLIVLPENTSLGDWVRTIDGPSE